MRADIIKLREVTIDIILKDGDLTSLLLKTYGALWKCVPKLCIKSLTLYHSKIRKQGFEKLELMEKTQKYLLKQGVRIYDHSNHAHYTVHNMTDAIAKKLLKGNPILANKFDKIPDPPKKKAKKTKK